MCPCLFPLSFLSLTDSLLSFCRPPHPWGSLLAWGSWCVSFGAEVHIPCGILCYPLEMHSLNLQVPQSNLEKVLWDTLNPQAFHSFTNTHLYSQIDAHTMYVIMADLKWTKPQALPLDASNGICWLTAIVIPLTKHDIVCVTHTSWDTHEMFVANHNLTEFWSPLKILSALRVGVRVKVEFTGNACFHHVLFTLLMYFMATGAYGYSGKAHIGAIIIQLFIKDVVNSPCLSFNNWKNT